MSPDARPWSYLAGFCAVVDRTPCPLHLHGSAEIVYHPEGSGRTALADGRAIAFAEGDAVIYAPFVRHDQHLDKPGRDVCLQVVWPEDLTRTLPPLMHVRGPLPEWLRLELLDLARRHADTSPRSARIRDHRATAVGLAMLDIADASLGEPPPTSIRQVEAATRWIAEHFADIGRIETVADAIGASYDSLRRDFRRHRGCSIVGWLSQVRISRAKELLANTPLRQHEIARQCGYTSARYLAMVFRRLVGMTPQQWRRRS